MATIQMNEMGGSNEDALDRRLWMAGGAVTVRPFTQCKNSQHPYDTQWVPFLEAGRCTYCGTVICDECNFAEDGEPRGCHRCVIFGGRGD